MEEDIAQVKDLVSRYLVDNERLTKQKLAFLVQTEPRMLLMEGLKLLSLCIEIDSCRANGCEHNTEDKSVEIILNENGILTPALCFVVPDGYKLTGNVLILLECFVRSSSANFEQKYLEDFKKLEQLKSDLESVNINLIPLIDGRTTFYNDQIPDWVNDKLRDTLFSLLKFSQESNALFEESEYSRLCESLSMTSGRLSGIESINVLKDNRTDHFTEIIANCHQGINNKMTSHEVKIMVEEEYQIFRNELRQGVIESQFVATDKENLLSRFSKLYEGEIADYDDNLDQLVHQFKRASPLLRFLYAELNEDAGRVRPADCDEQMQCWRSFLNKIKSLRILNTRRKLLLIFDAIILLASRFDLSKSRQRFPSGWLGSSFESVNDRLVSLESTKRDVKKWIEGRLTKNDGQRPRGVNRLSDRNETLLSIIKKTLDKAISTLKDVGIEITMYKVNMAIFDCDVFDTIMGFEMSGIVPTMSYQKTQSEMFPYTLGVVDLEETIDLKRLSVVCLALINSMKTSSTVRLRQNEFGPARYQQVRCKEAYCQGFTIDGIEFKLLYQKTGECSKCYAINNNEVGEVCSFYADPKRFFPAIFSDSVLQSVVDIMMSWIEDCIELKAKLKAVKLLTKMILVIVLVHPSKRCQKFLQNLRYFIMAFVSDFHHKDLMDKIREDLITEAELILYKLVRFLLETLLSSDISSMMTNRFKFILNVSYMCHFITKETPDRLTDQIKCFEKFLEPKLDFGHVSVNPRDHPEEEELEDMIHSIRRFLKKDTCTDGKGIKFKKPGVSKKYLSLLTSSFNNGSLFKEKEVKRELKDPLITSGCATALDLASNKSVVINKYTDGTRVLDYDFNKLTALAVTQLTEVFSRKGKYLLNKQDYDYKIQQAMSNLVLGPDQQKVGVEDGDLDDILFEGGASEYFERLRATVDKIVSQYREPNVEKNSLMGEGHPSVADLERVIDNKFYIRLIKGELSNHMVEDFDYEILPEEFYKSFCDSIYDNSDLQKKYFYSGPMNSCPIGELTKAVVTRTYLEAEYFQCFKSILLVMNANKLMGRYSHYRTKCLNFKFDTGKLTDDVRISERESNSEALSKALSLTNCTTAMLKNLCFYSQESPQSYNSIGPDTGRLKFSLSYKEQVGGNRELYIGDLRTKMFTRLIEDYFEALTGQLTGSCLNNEKEFDNAILSMKLNVSLAHVSYSMDHSKWGPMMCPFLFLAVLQNLVLLSKDLQADVKGRDYLSTLLTWHIHKMVEIPFNVASAMMKSYIKSQLGLRKRTSRTVTEDFFYSNFQMGVVPSHISSVLDMGQGILHNTSDFYALISERFINYAIKCVCGGQIDAYTSSDDQISLFDQNLTELLSRDPEEFRTLLEFHYYMSDQLNKFISPKSVIGRFVAEFKSRFYVWGDEVPLMTKFVAAALHNIKCKEPHQLAETIDTIIDQSVANGVPVHLCNLIQSRTLALLHYSRYPLDPFLLNCDTDVRDWVDGNRSYRIMRQIERLTPDACKKVRSMLRILFNKLKTGELHEEFTTNYLSGEHTTSLQNLFKLLDVEPLSESDLGYYWMNLAAHHPLRMVLRQKIVYSGAVNLDEEKVPTIVKTLQNKLSSAFTRGAQKLLSEAINKSAFQSSIASGFIGLCRTLGSKCVRGPERETLYIKSVQAQVMSIEGIQLELDGQGIQLWKVPPGIRLDQNPATSYLRPLMWDYMCIALSTAIELGAWVLGEPKEAKNLGFFKHNPCDYFPLRPTASKLLEDRVGANHIIHSLRRLYPSIFEKHLLPFMSDLASTKMKWSPRIKFLDLCVALDVNCEAMSLVSHIVKWKREEHYIVLASELRNSHTRIHEPMVEERVVSTADVLDNFMRQIYFESYVRSFVATTRTLGSFTWFPHKSSVPEGEGLKRLGPFSSFVEKVIHKGIERPMLKFDLMMGYAWIDFDIEPARMNFNQLIASGLTEEMKLDSLEAFLDCMSELPIGSIKFTQTIRYRIKSQDASFKETFSIHLNMSGFVDQQGRYVVCDVQPMYSGPVCTSVLVDCWRLAASSPVFKGKSTWFINSEVVNEFLDHTEQMGDVIPIDLVIEADKLQFHEYDFVMVGPEVEPVPLVVCRGSLWEGDKKLASFSPTIHDQDLDMFIKEAGDSSKDLLVGALKSMISDRLRQRMQWTGVDIVAVLTRQRPDDHKDVLSTLLEGLDDWVEFRGYSLCYSKSKKSVMVQSSVGSLRLKGRTCVELFKEPASVEDIE
uniref:RNA-directed RNA polymerase L n=1 Tax=Mammarenavirus lassaense TaxID=3052310 RepID=A0A7G6KMU2_LASV|nr:L polymerase [Mammarenavirus lassaense]QNC69552.1 L polymerase [Mammarenavirus lassaense]